MPWVRRLLRGSEVFARCREDGTLLADRDGRVDVKYKLDEGAKVYRASVKNLEKPAEGAGEILPDVERAPTQHPAGAVVVYTDGACSGNPGPMGIGVVVIDGKDREELSEYLGIGTNNIAELTAIERGLDLVAKRGATGRPVLVHTDSSYAIGLLSLGWKAKANVELVERIRAEVARFPRLRFVKVEGHAGVPENERCDELARAAVVRRA